MLSWFGRTQRAALRAYRDYMRDGTPQGRRPELVGGGLVRSVGGWAEVRAIRQRADRVLAEFLQRFLLHVLPDGFVRIRHFGLLANRGRAANLARCRALLAAPPPALPPAPETVAALLLRLTGVDLTRCPMCREGRLHVVAVFGPGELPIPALDTS